MLPSGTDKKLSIKNFYTLRNAESFLLCHFICNHFIAFLLIQKRGSLVLSESLFNSKLYFTNKKFLVVDFIFHS